MVNELIRQYIFKENGWRLSNDRKVIFSIRSEEVDDWGGQRIAVIYSDGDIEFVKSTLSPMELIAILQAFGLPFKLY